MPTIQARRRAGWLLGAGRGLLDVVLDVRCLRCGRPGTQWCDSCVRQAWLPQVVTGSHGLRAVAASPYEGSVRRALIAHKERGQLGLARPLGFLLARAVSDLASTGGVLLVPCPSDPAAVRARGQDHARRVADHAARVLRRRRFEAGVVVALKLTRVVTDQVGLGYRERWENRRHTMESRPPPARPQYVIIVDDITTSGSTLGEAHRALLMAGWPVLGAAVVARATPPRGLAHGWGLG